jgi:hypothetical protein
VLSSRLNRMPDPRAVYAQRWYILLPFDIELGIDVGKAWKAPALADNNTRHIFKIRSSVKHPYTKLMRSLAGLKDKVPQGRGLRHERVG